MAYDSLRKSTPQFIQEARAVHDDKYIYDKTSYVNVKTKITVTCPIHGDFSVTPNSHLSKKIGCPSCSNRKRRDTASFIRESKALYGNRFQYDECVYVNTNTPVVLLCPKHGRFETLPKNHIHKGHSCKKCGIERSVERRRKTTECFIEEARMVHGDEYDYSLVQYVNTKTKVAIWCNEHGVFFQSHDCHVQQGSGCPVCWNERRPPGKGGYTAAFFEKHPEQCNVPATFYVLHFTDGSDDFVKVGITTRTIKERFSVAGMGKFSYDILSQHDVTLFQAHTIETEILDSLKLWQYWPNHTFKGCTECLHNKEWVKEGIQQILHKYGEEWCIND